MVTYQSRLITLAFTLE